MAFHCVKLQLQNETILIASINLLQNVENTAKHSSYPKSNVTQKKQPHNGRKDGWSFIPNSLPQKEQVYPEDCLRGDLSFEDCGL